MVVKGKGKIVNVSSIVVYVIGLFIGVYSVFKVVLYYSIDVLRWVELD